MVLCRIFRTTPTGDDYFGLGMGGGKQSSKELFCIRFQSRIQWDNAMLAALLNQTFQSLGRKKVIAKSIES